MLKRIVEFFTGKKEPVVQPEAAPYKVEAPAVISPAANEPPKCGCGRSSTGLCVGLHACLRVGDCSSSARVWGNGMVVSVCEYVIVCTDVL